MLTVCPPDAQCVRWIQTMVDKGHDPVSVMEAASNGLLQFEELSFDAAEEQDLDYAWGIVLRGRSGKKVKVLARACFDRVLALAQRAEEERAACRKR